MNTIKKEKLSIKLKNAFDRVISENNQFSKRQLELNRDSQSQLISKFNSKKYAAYRDEIFEEIMSRNERALKSSKKKDKSIIYSRFIYDVLKQDKNSCFYTSKAA